MDEYPNPASVEDPREEEGPVFESPRYEAERKLMAARGCLIAALTESENEDEVWEMVEWIEDIDALLDQMGE